MTDRVVNQLLTELDGFDMSGLLFFGLPGLREVNYYHKTDGGGTLYAVRSGRYKLHLHTSGGLCLDTYYDAACYAKSVDHTESPILYNLEADPGEVNAVPASSAEYKEHAPRLRALADQHAASFWRAPSEMARGSNPERFPCCSPGCSPKPHCCKCA